MEPDLEGFRNASVKLRAAMGGEVVFLTPTGTVWPEGTPLDPQTQEPYDPAVQPIASGFASAAVPNVVVVRPGQTGRNDTTINGPIGEVESGDVVLLATIFDLKAAEAEDATLVELSDGVYEITEADRDSVGGAVEPDRAIIHARQATRQMAP